MNTTEHILISMLPYEWSRKSLGPPNIIPVNCPGCGADTSKEGWEYYGKINEFMCRECNHKYSLGGYQ